MSKYPLQKTLAIITATVCICIIFFISGCKKEEETASVKNQDNSVDLKNEKTYSSKQAADNLNKNIQTIGKHTDQEEVAKKAGEMLKSTIEAVEKSAPEKLEE